jgi:hypothetical protein
MRTSNPVESHMRKTAVREKLVFLPHGGGLCPLEKVEYTPEGISSARRRVVSSVERIQKSAVLTIIVIVATAYKDKILYPHTPLLCLALSGRCCITAPLVL